MVWWGGMRFTFSGIGATLCFNFCLCFQPTGVTTHQILTTVHWSQFITNSHIVDLGCVQAVMDHSHAMSGNAFTASREEYSRSPGGLSFHFGSKPRKKGPMRPSMELRHRQLDLSLLQVRPSACFLHRQHVRHIFRCTVDWYATCLSRV